MHPERKYLLPIIATAVFSCPNVSTAETQQIYLNQNQLKALIQLAELGAKNTSNPDEELTALILVEQVFYDTSKNKFVAESAPSAHALFQSLKNEIRPGYFRGLNTQSPVKSIMSFDR